MTRTTIKKWCVRVFFASSACLLLLCWLLGGKITAPVNRPVPIPQSNLPIVATQLNSESGSTIATWVVQHPTATATIVLAHPIRGDRRSMFTRAKLLFEHGYSVVLIDLQGHGESLGDNITIGHLESRDVRAAVEFARKKNPTHQVAVLGRSLGGAAALLGSPLEIDALVLESVYSTINDATFNRLSRRVGPLAYIVSPLLTAQLPIRLGISLDELRPIDHISNVGCPVLVMSGSLDERTTAAETNAMFAAAKAPKELVMFPNAAHVDLYSNDRKTYEQSLLAFLNRSL